MHNLTPTLPAASIFITLTLCISYVAISFGEHQIHQHIMHKKRLPEWLYRALPFAIGLFERHAIRHHGKWYREFDFEPHPEGRHENIQILPHHTLWLLILVSPLVAAFFAVSPLAGAIFITTLFAHNQLWNVLHGQMHMPEPVFFANWSIFRALCRNHYMHHQFTDKNYNVVFPLADSVLGTIAKPNIGQLREMMRLGYIQPKSMRAQARVKTLRTATSHRRDLQLVTTTI